MTDFYPEATSDIGADYRRRSAISVTQAVTSLVIVCTLTAGIALASEIVLTLFLAILFGIFLSRLSQAINERIPLPKGWSLAAVAALLLVTTAATISFFYVQIDAQIDAATQQVEIGFEELRSLVDESPTIRSIVTSIPFVSASLVDKSTAQRADTSEPNTAESDYQPVTGESAGEDIDHGGSGIPELRGMPKLGVMPEPIKQAANSIGQIFKTTFGLLVNSMLILFVGLFLAVAPHTYRDGIVKLVPPAKRQRASDVMDEIGTTLWRWLIGRFGSMLVTGVGAALLLWLIGVPMAGSLGIMTGLLTFIPNIGAAIALSLSILFALPQGVAVAGMVVPAYVGLQLVESYVVTPLIQKRQVSIPPALLIAFQAFMGVLFGILGAAVASPLLAALKVIIERLYVEDVLEAEGLN